VETFAALRLRIDNWRWGGVPVLIRAGKCMPVTATEVVVELIGPPAFFDIDPDKGNHYRFRLSPEVVIGLGTRIKAPGRAHGRTNYVELIARHDETGDDMERDERRVVRAPRIKAPGGEHGRTNYVELIARHDETGDDMEPYERLLGDAASGDATLFSREDAAEEAGRIFAPILDQATPVHQYEPGTWGPPQADELIKGIGHWDDPSETALHYTT